MQIMNHVLQTLGENFSNKLHSKAECQLQRARFPSTVVRASLKFNGQAVWVYKVVL